GVCDMADLA
nr:RecName: Full=Alveolarin [Neofavolus alveolaris]